MSTAEQPMPSGARKAAILLSLLGEEAAAPILRNLSNEHLERVTSEVASLSRVPFEVCLQVLEEYQQLMAAQEFMAMGGEDVALRLLVKAFGEAGAKSIVDRLNRGEEPSAASVDVLKKADPQQIARFLAGEQPQTRALILAQLDARQASAVLMKMEPQVRTECVKRLATAKQASPEIAAKISAVLNRRLRGSTEQNKRSDSGVRNLAEMMNRLAPAVAKEILDSLETEEPKIAISIRDMMFTFEDFLSVPEQDLRELVNSLDKKTLMVALKGASEEVKNHIFRTMSSRAVDMLKEDSEVMGPVRGKDVAKAQSEIVAIARKLEAEGKIVLKSEGEDEYVL